MTRPEASSLTIIESVNFVSHLVEMQQTNARSERNVFSSPSVKPLYADSARERMLKGSRPLVLV
jgi:hypothetical protein